MKLLYFLLAKICYLLYDILTYEQSVKTALLWSVIATKDARKLKRTMIFEALTGKSTMASSQYWEYRAWQKVSALGYEFSKKSMWLFREYPKKKHRLQDLL